MTVCSNCGVHNEDDAVFCRACHHYLEWAEAGGRRRRPAVPPPAAGASSADLARPAAPAPPEATQAPPAAPPSPGDPKAAPGGVPAPPPAPPVPAETELQRDADRVERAIATVEQARDLAAAHERDDLTEQLESTRVRLVERSIPVAVVGEFKRGKSSLVNALLLTDICPVDADVVTAVPTLVRYGAPPGATAYREPAEPDGEPSAEPIPLDAIGEYVSEVGNPGNRRQLRSVEVRLAHRLLRSGLCLVDTPGVGGLDSAHGLITLSALDLAQGILFVSDAAQEFTEPELGFLRMALERCPLAACVVTKTDLYPDWRRIVALNEGHLRSAGLELPVIPVSSFLRRQASRQPALSEEAGFRPLIEFLAGNVVRRTNAAAADAADNAVRFVTAQVGREIEAEEAVLAQPARAAAVVGELSAARDRSAVLASSAAAWQQVLSDGIQDLAADIDHDLQERLRAVLRDVEAIINEGDPKGAWNDIEVWLRRQVVSAGVDNFDAMAARAEALAVSVAQRLDLDAGDRTWVEVGASPAALAALPFAPVAALGGAGRLGSMLMAARMSAFAPMVLFGVAGSLLAPIILAPVSVVLAAGIGQKLVRDERQRQLTYRRQQAQAAARRYVDDARFILVKESRGALRRTQRSLRDDFQSRAAAIHRSSVGALEAAQHASRLPPAARRARAAELAQAAEQQRRVGDLVGAAAVAHG